MHADWKRHRDEFLEIADGSPGLSALLVRADLTAEAETSRRLASDLIETPAAHGRPWGWSAGDAALELVERADKYDVLALDSDYDARGEWVLQGGTADVCRRFEMASSRAARAAGVSAEGDSHNSSMRSWLHFINDHLNDGVRRMAEDHVLIEDVLHASACLCRDLEKGDIHPGSANRTKLPASIGRADLAAAKPSAVRQDDVDAFLDRVRSVRDTDGRRVYETYIWRTICKYKDDSEYQDWKFGRPVGRTESHAFEVALATPDADLPRIPPRGK